jgi:protein SCO1/2
VNKHFLPRLFQVLTGVLLGLAVALWILRPEKTGQETDPGRYFLDNPLPAPSFTLTSHRGEVVRSSDFGDKLLVVFFGYTFCPDVCPLTLSHLSQALRDMGEDRARIQVLFVSVDPMRDTPERLARFLGNFDSSFLGLTGSEEEIRAVADAFGVYFARAGEGDDYTVDHTARTYVIDPAGLIPLTFPVTATPREMTLDLAVLLEELE